MKKRLKKYIVIGAIAIVGTLGYNFSINQEDASFQFIAGNIEALANEEGGGVDFIVGKCENTSTEPCQIQCPNCKLTYLPGSGRNAPLTSIFGQCSCGHRF